MSTIYVPLLLVFSATVALTETLQTIYHVSFLEHFPTAVVNLKIVLNSEKVLNHFAAISRLG